MRIEKVREKARKLGVKSGNKSKTELIRCIQLVEGNFDCFGRSSGYCDQWTCCWREDCLSPVCQ